MEALWWLLVQIAYVIWSVLWWIVGYLLWLTLWVFAPVILIAILVLRGAELALGRDAVRAWLKKQSLKVGAGAWQRTSRALLALSVMPFRVLAWLILYSLWHVLISLLWTPRWSPWERAWNRRRRSKRPT